MRIIGTRALLVSFLQNLADRQSADETLDYCCNCKGGFAMQLLFLKAGLAIIVGAAFAAAIANALELLK
jgi:hypothetical protein